MDTGTFWHLMQKTKTLLKNFISNHSITIIEREGSFVYPNDIATTIEKAYSGVVSLNKSFEVRLWVDKEIAPYFERKPYHGQSIEGRDADGLYRGCIKSHT